MAISAVEGIVENGQIHLRDDVSLPEHARVYVIIPDMEVTLPSRVRSPRLARPEQAGDFAKQIIKLPDDAEL